ncbi:MAG TPA: Mu-like prophage major head subunit gpT family protein [candidate division Zixibacteria bacterium]|nr:Mu-like prophage major head subunit gpT family protein [candidate division Zixibacteria bacterium]
MPMPRASFPKGLEEGLNTLFGLSYKAFPTQYTGIFEHNTSKKAFEEDVLMEGFGEAPEKSEGGAVSYDTANEVWTKRYTHKTYALAFALTQEAEEDHLYMSLGRKYVKALARSMHHTKEITGANILNNGFDSAYAGGDGKELLATDHPTSDGNQSNELATSADLNETSLEQILINISQVKDDRGIPLAATGLKLIIPPALVFVAERLLQSSLRVDSANNDINAIKSAGYCPQGFVVNQRLTDTDAWFIKTDCPDGLKYFQRIALQKGMEGDFETGNLRYKTRERYAFGHTDWRGVFGSPGA